MIRSFEELTAFYFRQLEELAGHSNFMRKRFDKRLSKLLERRFFAELSRVEEIEREERKGNRTVAPSRVPKAQPGEVAPVLDSGAIDRAALNLVIDALHEVFKKAPEAAPLFVKSLPDVAPLVDADKKDDENPPAASDAENELKEPKKL